MSKNYYQTYAGQTHFLEPYLKPVHVLFFRFHQHTNTLDCILLSQREAKEVTAFFKEPSERVLAKHHHA